MIRIGTHQELYRNGLHKWQKLSRPMKSTFSQMLEMDSPKAADGLFGTDSSPWWCIISLGLCTHHNMHFLPAQYLPCSGLLPVTISTSCTFLARAWPAHWWTDTRWLHKTVWIRRKAWACQIHCGRIIQSCPLEILSQGEEPSLNQKSTSGNLADSG